MRGLFVCACGHLDTEKHLSIVDLFEGTCDNNCEQWSTSDKWSCEAATQRDKWKSEAR